MNLLNVEVMKEWEEKRIKVRGDGVKFMLVFLDFEEYFEDVRRLVGELENGVGRRLLKF